MCYACKQDMVLPNHPSSTKWHIFCRYNLVHSITLAMTAASRAMHFNVGMVTFQVMHNLKVDILFSNNLPVKLQLTDMMQVWYHV